MSATEQTAPKSTAPKNRDEQIIALLQKIVELLDEIDGSLANIGGKLDEIHGRLP